MQFIWPFKAEYRIIYLSDNYSTTVIGRTKRDYVWIMAREPSISEEEYAFILKFLQEQDYDIRQVQKVPHQIVGASQSSFDTQDADITRPYPFYLDLL